MKIVGYGNKLSVEQGGDIDFMVSSEAQSFDAQLIRLIHGDDDPHGPGFKYEPVASSLAGRYAGRHQKLRPGSYVRIPRTASFDPPATLTLHLWMCATLPDVSPQTLISFVSPQGGCALRLVDGHLSLHAGSDLAMIARLVKAVEARTWYSVTAILDSESGSAHLSLDALASTGSELSDRITEEVEIPGGPGACDILIAAEAVTADGQTEVGNFFNGKIDSPHVYGTALGDPELAAICEGGTPQRGDLLAAWDFSNGISTSTIIDTSGNGLNAYTVNKPMRGATGWNWTGVETCWRHAPDQYGAIHFHDDDLDDAGWDRSLGWTVPDDLASGVYAVHLEADSAEDFIPFIVRPRAHRATAEILLVVPTFSYLAYGNEHTIAGGEETLEHLGISGSAAREYPSTPQDRYIIDNRLNSLYDRHSDGSGVCYSSRLRPLVNMRPKYRMPGLNNGEGSPHQFNADLHLVDWLHESGYAVDVATDEDLHIDGLALLEPYNVVLTGSHHEYWSGEMIAATQQYLRDGGRLMYLGGNGMYWVTQLDRENGNGIEVRRRGPSTRMWEPEPGEAHLAATGELGGIWRYRGLSPQSWLGVGFTAQGMGEGRPYDRQPDGFSEAGAWVFEGVGEDERIGDFPVLLNGYGAAGFEIDRADHNLGTPRKTLVLATASGFSDSFQHVVEEVLLSDSAQGGTVSEHVRADMILLEYPNDGAVFSTGSISWCAALSHNSYDNNVSRITHNVLERFSSGRKPIGRVAEQMSTGS